MLKEIEFKSSKCSQIWTNNLGVKYLAHNLVFHFRMMINFNFVRELVKHGVIQVTNLSTQQKIADGFKKPLSSSKNFEIKSKLDICVQT